MDSQRVERERSQNAVQNATVCVLCVQHRMGCISKHSVRLSPGLAGNRVCQEQGKDKCLSRRPLLSSLYDYPLCTVLSNSLLFGNCQAQKQHSNHQLINYLNTCKKMCGVQKQNKVRSMGFRVRKTDFSHITYQLWRVLYKFFIFSFKPKKMEIIIVLNLQYNEDQMK